MRGIIFYRYRDDCPAPLGESDREVVFPKPSANPKARNKTAEVYERLKSLYSAEEDFEVYQAAEKMGIWTHTLRNNLTTLERRGLLERRIGYPVRFYIPESKD